MALTRFPARSVVLLSLGVLSAAPATPDGPASHVSLPSPAIAPPEADPGRFSLGPLLDPELLRDLPLGGDVWSAFEIVESTAILNRMASGGMYTGEPGLMGVRGSSWTNASWRLGDLDITDPDRPGTPLLLVDPQALEEIVVSAGVMPAEQGGAGPAVSLALRRPGTAWHRAVQMDTVPAGLQQSYRRNKAPAIASYGSYGSGRFQLDGPLIQDRLGLFVSGTLARGSRRERSDPRELAGRETGLLANLIWRRNSRDEVRFVGAAQDTLRPYAGRARFGGGDVREADRFLQLQSTWLRQGPRPWSVSGGYVRGAFDPQLPALAGIGVVDRLADGPVQELFPGHSVRSRWALTGWLDPLTDAHHALRVGASLARSSSSTRPAGPPGLTAETVDGLPARVWDFGWAGPESHWRAFDLAAYADDQITYGRLSVDAGLRFEATHASRAGSSGTIDWDALSPRLLARFRPARWRGLALLAGYARYRHRLPLNLLGYGDPAAAQGLVYRWLDANGDRVFQPGEQGPLVARIGPGGPDASIDRGLQAPTSREVFVGCDVRAGAWNVRFLAYHRREFHLVTSVDVGAPLSAYDVSFVPDPGNDIAGGTDNQMLPIYNRRPESFGADRYVLTNDAEKGQDKGYELAISGMIGKRFRLLVGGTNSISMSPAGYRGFLVTENDQGLVGERLEDPNAQTSSKGRLFFERGYTLKAAASYRAPGDLRLGIAARYQDGQHFARMVIPTYLNQGPEPIQAVYNGRSRFSYVLTVDARVEKGFTIGRARLAAVLEAFNFPGEAVEVEESVAWGPTYRDTSAVQPPRAFRLGVRVDF